LCKLDLDMKELQIKEIKDENRAHLINIIKILPKFYSHLSSLTSIFCTKYGKLEIIDMSRAKIDEIEPSSLEKCKDLRVLQFYMNQLDNVPENLFSENKKLQKLYISYNLIRTLPENLFLGLLELKLLDLSYNHIDVLLDNIFQDLKDLKDLNLEGNQLKNLEPVLFEHLEKLEKLNLNSNGISELPIYLFSNLRNLKDLSLMENKLTIIHADSFPLGVHIDTVVFTKNKINAIDEYFIESCGISNLKMDSNICDKTNTIKKKDMKKKLKKCFDNYIITTEGMSCMESFANFLTL